MSEARQGFTDVLGDVELEMIGKFQVHPVASLFPLLEGEEFDSLVDDIRSNGLLVPVRWITTDRGRVVIDGRNRLRACAAAEVSPVGVEVKPPVDVLNYVMSANLRRRQMTTGQKAAIAAELMPACQARAKARQGVRTDLNIMEKVPGSSGAAREEAARMAGVNSAYVQQALRLQREAPDLFAKIKSGEINRIPKAMKELKRRQEPELTSSVNSSTSSVEPPSRAPEPNPSAPAVKHEASPAASEPIEAEDLSAPAPEHPQWSRVESEAVPPAEESGAVDVEGESKSDDEAQAPELNLPTRLQRFRQFARQFAEDSKEFESQMSEIYRESCSPEAMEEGWSHAHGSGLVLIIESGQKRIEKAWQKAAQEMEETS